MKKLKEFFTSKAFAFLTIGLIAGGAVLGLLDHFLLETGLLGEIAGSMIFTPIILVGIICSLAEYQDKGSARFCVPLGFFTVILLGSAIISAIFFPLERVGLSREEFSVAYNEYRAISFQVMGVIFLVLFFLRIILKSFNKLLPSFE